MFRMFTALLVIGYYGAVGIGRAELEEKEEKKLKGEARELLKELGAKEGGS